MDKNDNVNNQEEDENSTPLNNDSKSNESISIDEKDSLNNEEDLDNNEYEIIPIQVGQDGSSSFFQEINTDIIPENTLNFFINGLENVNRRSRTIRDARVTHNKFERQRI